MTPTTHPSPLPPAHAAEKAITLALRLAHAENALHALTAGQVDAIVDPDGKAYLLRPAQEHLRQNERRLQALIDSSADVLTVVNRRGAIVSQSQAVRRVLGYEPDELVGSSLFEFIHEEDWPAVHSAFFNVLEGYHESGTTQFRHRSRDGSYRMIEGTLGRLSEGPSASVVFSLRLLTGFLRKRLGPPLPSAWDLSQAGENRECITLSHGRRIPIMRPGLGLDASQSPPP